MNEACLRLANDLDSIINKYISEREIPTREYIYTIAVLFTNFVRLIEESIPENEVANARMGCLDLVASLVLDDDFLNNDDMYSKTTH